MTSLNLYATKFDQVLSILEKRSAELEYVFLDTPGQIEVFTWSASGSIITESLANSMPTVLLYVIDTPRTSKPATFMSNMLYACSILYKTTLPMVVVFNKVDIQSHDFAAEWMTDFESFQEALNAEDDSSYSTSLTQSMGLALEEFYNHLHFVGVSSFTGEGFGDLMEAISLARKEYVEGYYADLQEKIKAKADKSQEGQKTSLDRLSKDLGRDVTVSGTSDGAEEEEEEEGDEEEEGEGDEGDDEELADFTEWVSRFPPKKT